MQIIHALHIFFNLNGNKNKKIEKNLYKRFFIYVKTKNYSHKNKYIDKNYTKNKNVTIK